MDNMSVEITNASSAHPELAQTWPQSTFDRQSALPGFLAGWSTWHYVVTFLLSVVVYDQGKPSTSSPKGTL